MPRETLQTLTESMVYILLSLRGECSGVDIMEKAETLSQGHVTVGLGTLYTMLPKRMANGLIQQTRQAGRQKSSPRRGLRAYRRSTPACYPGSGQAPSPGRSVPRRPWKL